MASAKRPREECSYEDDVFGREGPRERRRDDKDDLENHRDVRKHADPSKVQRRRSSCIRGEPLLDSMFVSSSENVRATDPFLCQLGSSSFGSSRTRLRSARHHFSRR